MTTSPRLIRLLLTLALQIPATALASSATSEGTNSLSEMDVFELEWVTGPRVSPDGKTIAYSRNGYDVMTDRPISRIWLASSDGDQHRPLTDRSGSSPRWSPGSDRIAFLSVADNAVFLERYWFAKPPWEDPESYLARSPLSFAGQANTSTMLLTGEQDHRTPISESEQFYQALKLRGVDSALVRIPDASHGIAARPSHLISKVQHVLAWFERYADDP